MLLRVADKHASCVMRQSPLVGFTCFLYGLGSNSFGILLLEVLFLCSFLLIYSFSFLGFGWFSLFLGVSFILPFCPFTQFCFYFYLDLPLFIFVNIFHFVYLNFFLEDRMDITKYGVLLKINAHCF